MKNKTLIFQTLQYWGMFCCMWVVATYGYSQDIYNLQNKTIILAPLNDSLCQQSVYTQEALKENQFIDKYLYKYSIYGQPIHIDSVYVINPKSKHKQAVIMELTHNNSRVAYYIPLHFNRTKGMKSYMWHTMNSLQRRRRDVFDKSSYYCKTFGNYEDVDINNIHFEYCDVDSMANDKAILRALRDSCAATYNQKELLPFIEKYKGKEVWLVSNLHDAARYWKMNDSANKHHIWLTESRNMWGTAKKSFETGFLGSFNDITGVKCQCHGVVLLPNLGNKTRWTPKKTTWGDGVNLNINHKLFQEEFDRDYIIRIHGNQYKGQWVENAQNPRKGPIQLLYKYYVVFTICPNLTYECKGSLVDNPMTADTLFVDYNKELYKLILLEDDFQQKFKQHEDWEKAQWDEYNRMEAARYRYAIQQWGERIADKIQHGLLEFGFSPEMCVQARREEPYKIDKVTTPFGLATRYNFYQSQLKLYFINDQLIGIQTKEKSPLYYM